jgi:hypothetical protein
MRKRMYGASSALWVMFQNMYCCTIYAGILYAEGV